MKEITEMKHEQISDIFCYMICEEEGKNENELQENICGHMEKVNYNDHDQSTPTYHNI